MGNIYVEIYTGESTVPAENNGYVYSKVLSRQHAEEWKGTQTEVSNHVTNRSLNHVIRTRPNQRTMRCLP
jgi:CTP synthase (UTP-ammonia lyase)